MVGRIARYTVRRRKSGGFERLKSLKQVLVVGVLVSPGWMQVYGPGAADADDADDRASDAEDKKELVPYVKGERVTAVGVELKMLKTKPPQGYTEDTLLGAMETAGRLIDDEEQREAMKDRGLGTPVTRSAMIESLLAAKDGSNRKKDPYTRPTTTQT